MSPGKPLFPEICKVPRTTGVLKIRNDRLETVHTAYVCVRAREGLSLSLSTDAYAHINIRVGKSVWRAARNGTENGNPIYLWVLRPWNWSRVSGTRRLSSSRSLSSTLGDACARRLLRSAYILLLHDFTGILLYRLRTSYLSKPSIQTARITSDLLLPHV